MVHKYGMEIMVFRTLDVTPKTLINILTVANTIKTRSRVEFECRPLERSDTGHNELEECPPHTSAQREGAVDTPITSCVSSRREMCRHENQP